MKTTKINIGIALSRNYDKISLDLIEEIIEHETEEQLREKIRTRLKMLREEIERDFGKDTTKPQTPTETPQKVVEKATDKQKKFLGDLGYEGKVEELSKVEATALIKELLETPQQDY